MAIRRRKPKGPKKVPYRLIDRESGAGQALYPLLSRLVDEYHKELQPAKIALAWHAGWKADVDGRRKLGMLKKCSDLDREFRPFDFVIVLNRLWFEDAENTDAQRAAILDHELCHAARKYDTNDEPMEDERGRPVWRTVRHDVEEFSAVIERHGTYKRDLEMAAAAIARNKAQGNLFDLEPNASEPTPANGNGNGKGETRLIPAGEFTKALKKECREKGWTAIRRADGQVEIRVPAVQ